MITPGSVSMSGTLRDARATVANSGVRMDRSSTMSLMHELLHYSPSSDVSATARSQSAAGE